MMFDANNSKGNVKGGVAGFEINGFGGTKIEGGRPTSNDQVGN